MKKNLKIIATGEEWIGNGIRSFLGIIKDSIMSSNEYILMTIYIITNKKIIKYIKSALNRGVLVELFIYSQDLNNRFLESKELKELNKEYKYFNINVIRNKILHAKVMVIDYKKVILGSANLTFGGMVKNYELGFFIEDEIIAKKIITILKRLI